MEPSQQRSNRHWWNAAFVLVEAKSHGQMWFASAVGSCNDDDFFSNLAFVLVILCSAKTVANRKIWAAISRNFGSACDKEGLAWFGINQSKWPIHGSFGHMYSWLNWLITISVWLFRPAPWLVTSWNLDQFRHPMPDKTRTCRIWIHSAQWPR